jgi:hypothetical protein
LQTGTGLGLAIVNSILQTKSVSGKVDVWSEENVGTEIKVNVLAEVVEDSQPPTPEMTPMKFDDPAHPPSVSLVGFDLEHKGARLLHSVVITWLSSWWGFAIHEDASEYGDIVILNGDVSPVESATQRRDTSKPFICLMTPRGSPRDLMTASDHERIGGFCRIVYKPGGPSRLYSALKFCLHALTMKRNRHASRASCHADDGSSAHHVEASDSALSQPFPRRNSAETETGSRAQTSRPSVTRARTAHPTAPVWTALSSTYERDESGYRSRSRSERGETPPVEDGLAEVFAQVPAEAEGPGLPKEEELSVAFGSNGTLLQSSVGSIPVKERLRVLVVEDNSILRSLLCVVYLSLQAY